MALRMDAKAVARPAGEVEVVGAAAA